MILEIATFGDIQPEHGTRRASKKKEMMMKEQMAQKKILQRGPMTML